MTTEPLDPAAIMANHQAHHDSDGVWCSVCYEPGQDGGPVAHPCETYRLAADLVACQEVATDAIRGIDQMRTLLAAERGKVADAWDQGWRHGSGMRAILQPKDNPYRTGEGAADQPTSGAA
jgi:hypothetical protein